MVNILIFVQVSWIKILVTPTQAFLSKKSAFPPFLFADNYKRDTIHTEFYKFPRGLWMEQSRI